MWDKVYAVYLVLLARVCWVGLGMLRMVSGWLEREQEECNGD